MAAHKQTNNYQNRNLNLPTLPKILNQQKQFPETQKVSNNDSFILSMNRAKAHEQIGEHFLGTNVSVRSIWPICCLPLPSV